MEQAIEKMRARYRHCEKRAEQLEEQWESGERMNGTVMVTATRSGSTLDASARCRLI